MRIGVNALYLIPGGVGGTEIYLRSLLTALAEIDHHNQYFVFTNRETGPDLVPAQANFTRVAAGRACRQPSGAHPLGADPAPPGRRPTAASTFCLNPGFTAPTPLRLPAGHGISRLAAQAASRILPLVRSAVLEFLSVLERHRFAPDRSHLRRHGGRPAPLVSPAARQDTHRALGCRSALLRTRRAPPPGAVPARGLHPAPAQESGWPAARLRRLPRTSSRSTASSSAAFTGSSRRNCTPCATGSSCADQRGIPGLDSARTAIRSLRARHGVSLSQPVRRLRVAGAGSAGRRRAHRLFRDRADEQHRRRRGPEIRSARSRGNRRGDGPPGHGRANFATRLAAAGPLRAAQFSWRTTAQGILALLRSMSCRELCNGPPIAYSVLGRQVNVSFTHSFRGCLSRWRHPAGAQQFQRRATMVGGGGGDRGKCTIEVVVDGVGRGGNPRRSGYHQKYLRAVPPSGAASSAARLCRAIRLVSASPASMAAGGSNWYAIRATAASPSSASKIPRAALKAIPLTSSGAVVRTRSRSLSPRRLPQQTLSGRDRPSRRFTTEQAVSVCQDSVAPAGRRPLPWTPGGVPEHTHRRQSGPQ